MHQAGGGQVATLTAVSGGTPTARTNGPRNVVLRGEKGNVAGISTYDVHQSTA